MTMIRISGKQFLEMQNEAIKAILWKTPKSENDIILWNHIKTKFNKCSLCGGFNSLECAMCYSYKGYILDAATSPEEAHDYLRKLERKFSTDDLYTFEDYENDES